MRLSNKIKLLLMSIFILVAILGLSTYKVMEMNATNQQKTAIKFPIDPPKLNSESYKFADNASVYINDEDTKVEHIYITVLPPNESKYSSFGEVNGYAFHYSKPKDKPVARAFFETGTAKGTGIKNAIKGNLTPNALIEPRGRSTSGTEAKSYQITVSDKMALWGGQKIINLNKHPFDHSRIRNKLSYDYYELIPNIVSLRTKFVILHVKDLSANQAAKFEDYGLYTHVEQVNKKYLKAHGLDSDGNLYKANLFEFFRYEDILLQKSDPNYSEEKFNNILEIRGSSDHSKLLRMLDDLNDRSIDIDLIIEKYFDRENYSTWLASNIIIGNIDTASQNFYLYSPQSLERFYFIPWDCDGAWGWIDQYTVEEQTRLLSEWQWGIQNLWGSNLNNRFLRKASNVRALDEKIEELMKIYTREQTKSFLDSYYPIIIDSFKKPEELIRIGSSSKKFAKSFNLIVDAPEKNLKIYRDSKEKPMPVFLNAPESEGGLVEFSWGDSYDLQGDDILYDVIISTTPDLKSVVQVIRDLRSTEAEVSLSNGLYYYGVIIKDSKGNEMIPFDTFTDLEGVTYHGVMQFEVK